MPAIIIALFLPYNWGFNNIFKPFIFSNSDAMVYDGLPNEYLSRLNYLGVLVPILKTGFPN